MYRPDDRWVWDFWLVQDGSLWHMFHLQAPRTVPPEQRHWHAVVGHATSSDLVNWSPQTTAVEPGVPGTWDDTAIWTGSVILHHSGRWLMAYTGITQAKDSYIERVGLAWSDDLTEWEKEPSNPVLESDPRWYENPGSSQWQHGWRDPFLIPTGDGRYSMLLSARLADAGSPFRAGAIGAATSDDGINWIAREPIPGTDGHFAQLEVPQLVTAGDRHHLIFCTNSDGPWPRNRPGARPKIGTGEFVGEHPFGPYEGPPTFIDADAIGTRYAGRIFTTESGEYTYLAFLDGGARSFVGGISDPIPVGLATDSGRFMLLEHPSHCP